jgi:Na+-transporting NADH:ubiquinone oxidoreductase subunit A
MSLRNLVVKSVFIFSLMLFAEIASAQSMGSSITSNILMWIVAILVFFALLFVGDSLLKLEARNSGVDKNGKNYSIFPSFSDIFSPKLPDFVPDENLHVLAKGHDVVLEGKATSTIDTSAPKAKRFAIRPTDFLGIAPIPKMLIAEGDNVKAGDPLFFDKKNDDVKFCSPVSGEIIAINRGAKRAISEVIILADNKQEFRSYDAPKLDAPREELISFLADAGVWPMIRRRPYHLLADRNEVPRDIFISTFDSAPLAPDANLFVEGKEAAFQKGLEVLAKLTPGKVYLGLNAKLQPAAAYADATGVEKHYFHGKHPVGNVGIQIHHTKPMGTQDVVWTMAVQDVITMGTLFTEGKFDAERVVVLAGAELKEAKYVKTYIGAAVVDLIKDNITDEDITVRLISGDVLSGQQVNEDGFLGFFDDQITAIKEGNYNEIFGWLLPLAPRPSVSRTMPGFLMPNFEYRADTNTHGEQRAFVVTGQYESVLPMDLYPQHLMKAILIGDFERMEGLGINELAPEDIAICEFACTSKQPLQSILRDGHEMMLEQV